ncbi:hypothetical protein KTH33_06980 [Acinetobacter johnsonii]|jgi:hypothetical protein|uniref:hypothetical protein n=1 Tax=Acinetobacter johnsonii TaxID=40214 RepID=UPI0021CDA864|nr:hypothetical protein [Acinetobacter johnsonii]MCU4326340.1 hypothetical protein [Acinetobacter johnsonii]MDH0840515.1 hypothetical protein [Acinetobacter johnsonii]
MTQQNQFQMQLLDLVGELVKQNSQVLAQNNQLIQHLTQQSNQINELLLILEDQEEANVPRYMDE